MTVDAPQPHLRHADRHHRNSTIRAKDGHEGKSEKDEKLKEPVTQV